MFDETYLSDKVFGNGVDNVNVVERYQSCSFQQLNFTKAENRSVVVGGQGGVGNISNGVVTVTLDFNVTDIDRGVVKNAVTDALKTEFDVGSPNELANHVYVSHFLAFEYDRVFLRVCD